MLARPLLYVCLIAAVTGGGHPDPCSRGRACSSSHGTWDHTLNVRLPEGAGCSGEAARYRAVMDNDLATGHVSKGVYQQVTREIDQAGAACAAGREVEAVRMVQASKARHGYR